MSKYYSLAALLFFSGAHLATQAQELDRARLQAAETKTAPELITLRSDQKRRGLQEAQTVLNEYLPLTPDDQFKWVATEHDHLGFTHEKYIQYFKDVRVEHGTYSVHAKGGVIESLSGDFVLIKDLDMAPKLSADAALRLALDFVGAERYMWQDNAEEAILKTQEHSLEATYLPHGELVVVRRQLSPDSVLLGQPVLAWKFNVYAQQPVSRSYIYVDAHSGEVVLQDDIIKHGTVATAYSGTQTSATSSANGRFRLRDYSRGQGIETYNLQRGTRYGNAIDFTDLDDNWTAAEFNNSNADNAGLDAHWGAQATYDYWRNVHGRNSFDNAGAVIKSYVHFGQGYDNAFWNGSVMTYGDGSKIFQPLTSLDICGHEIGHALCERTANLTYSGESGALNEGFSDIWGACIEQYTTARLGLTKQTWLLAEEITKQQYALRSMSDPKSLGQPAYYRGQNWKSTSSRVDKGGVHTNSGVLNHWFYILSVGKTGSNEGGGYYQVTGIGIEKAAQIAYRAESVYLTASSNYNAARTYTLQAATDLFGSCSPEVLAVTNAWYAVGVGPSAPIFYISGGANQLCSGDPNPPTFQSNQYATTWTASPAGLFNVTTGSGPTFTTTAVYGAQGTGTITARFCGQVQTRTVKVGASEASGYFYGGGRSSTPLQTVQFVSPGQISLFLNEPFTFTFTSSSPAVNLTNTTGTSTSFYLGPNQGVSIRVTSSQPSCGLASQFVFSAQSVYGYRFGPNPSSDELIVTANSLDGGSPVSPGRGVAAPADSFTAELYDNFGRKVRAQAGNQGQAVLNVRDLPNGLYNLRVGTGKNALLEHIRIEH